MIMAAQVCHGVFSPVTGLSLRPAACGSGRLGHQRCGRQTQTAAAVPAAALGAHPLPPLAATRNPTNAGSTRRGSRQVCGVGAELAEVTAESVAAYALLATVPLLAGVAGWRGILYGKMEYIKASLLGNWVPKGAGARVIMSGGSTRDLYYMPKGTVQVTYVGKDLKASLLDQAGMQAGVPVKTVNASPEELEFQPDNSVDAVVAYNTLGPGGRRYLEEVVRVLKPGCPLLFVDRVKAQGWQSVTQALLGGGGGLPEIGDLEALFETVDRFDDVSCDLALAGDPHLVGVAVLLGESDDDNLMERRISKRRNRKKVKK